MCVGLMSGGGGSRYGRVGMLQLAAAKSPRPRAARMILHILDIGVWPILRPWRDRPLRHSCSYGKVATYAKTLARCPDHSQHAHGRAATRSEKSVDGARLEKLCRSRNHEMSKSRKEHKRRGLVPTTVPHASGWALLFVLDDGWSSSARPLT